jgi:hypothetical protein
MIGSLTSQKRDLFPLDSFFFFCLFSLLTSHRVLYEYKKSDIHSLSPSLFPVYAALSLVRWFAYAHYHHSYYCIKMQIYECVSEKGENERERERKNWVSPIWIFLVVKREHFIESAAFLSCTFFFSSSHFYQSNWFWPFWVNGIFIRFIVSRIHTP